MNRITAAEAAKLIEDGDTSCRERFFARHDSQRNFTPSASGFSKRVHCGI